jgi:hypothetical protein
MSINEWKCLSVILIENNGTDSRLTLHDFEEATDISAPNVCKALFGLYAKGIIRKGAHSWEGRLFLAIIPDF